MKNLLVLTYWSYPDALIQTYTLPYIYIIQKNLPAGSRIFFLTLEKDDRTLRGDDRTKIRNFLAAHGIHWLPFKYRSFGVSAFFLWAVVFLRLCILILIKKISTIHCWCTPPGAIGYFLSIISGQPLVLDSYEPHAESMVENGTWRANGLAFKLLFWLEKKQTQRASYTVSATAGMLDYAKAKYNTACKNFFVKPACVDMTLFSDKQLKDPALLKKFGFEDKIVCVYAGKFGGIYLEQEVFDFFKVAAGYWGDKFRVLLLTSHTSAQITDYIQKAGLLPQMVTTTFVKHDEVPRYLGLGDFAISPVKPIPTKRYCTPIKNGEYWAMGLPVVIPFNISDDSEIIAENKIGSILYHFDDESYLKSVMEIDQILQKSRADRFKAIRAIALRYRNFGIAEKVYQEIYGGQN